MFTCSRRPGRPPSQGARPLKRSSERRVRNRISPIQMNSGSAVKVHDDDAVQIVVAMASPTGRLVNSYMQTRATPSSERPTKTTPTRRKNSTPRKTRGGRVGGKRMEEGKRG